MCHASGTSDRGFLTLVFRFHQKIRKNDERPRPRWMQASPPDLKMAGVLGLRAVSFAVQTVVYGLTLL